MNKYHTQGGDITNGDGSGGKSALDENISFESLQIRHSEAGFIGVMGSVPNDIERKMSQFYITLAPLPGMDGTGVVFGKVNGGISYIRTNKYPLTCS